MSELDVSLDQRIVEHYMPVEPHEGFMRRRGDFVDSIRGQVLGGIAATGGAYREDSGDFADRMRSVFEQHRSEITLFRAVKGLDNYLAEHDWRYEGEQQLGYQTDAMHDILGGLSRSHPEGYVEMATATGKGYMISKLVEAFHMAGLRVLALAPTKTIGRQIINGIAENAPNVAPEAVGVQMDSKRAAKEDRVVVSTYQSLNRFAQNGDLGEFDVVIADEAHRGLGQATSQTIKSFSPNAIKIGLTATPEYGVNKSVSQIFPYRYHQLGLREAIESDHVLPVQCMIYTTGERIKIYDKNRADFTDRELARLMHLKSRNQKVVQLAKNFVEDGRQGIIPCVQGDDLLHARLIADGLSGETVTDRSTGQKRPLIARAVGSSIPETVDILKAFEAGEVDVLTFVGLIAEGWDSKKPGFLINACPTTSIVKITQQIGRVIRKDPGKPPAIVVDFVDETVGKQQKTALHALGEEVITVNKVYGNPSQWPSGYGEWHNYLRGMLDPDLYNHLMSVDGMLLHDVLIPPDDAVVQKQSDMYEKILADEGMPAEVHPMGVPLETLTDIQAARDEFQAAYNREMLGSELVDYMIELNMVRSTDKAKENLGKALVAEVVEPVGLMFDLPNADPDMPDKPSGWRYEGALDGMDSMLDARQRIILKLRFGIALTPEEQEGLQLPEGFGPDRPLTLDEVAVTQGLTRERIRQIEVQSMSRLRSSDNLNRKKTGTLSGEPDEIQANLRRGGLLTNRQLATLQPYQQADYREALERAVVEYRTTLETKSETLIRELSYTGRFEVGKLVDIDLAVRNRLPGLLLDVYADKFHKRIELMQLMRKNAEDFFKIRDTARAALNEKDSTKTLATKVYLTDDAFSDYVLRPLLHHSIKLLSEQDMVRLTGRTWRFDESIYLS